MTKITKHIEQEAKLHALAEYPKECCGVVQQKKYFRCTNIAEDPTKAFEIKEDVFPEVDLVIHSHPDGSPCPSKSDMEGQIESAVPWGIVATDGVNTSDVVWFGDECPIVDLVGREFIHGVYDCYNLVRDYYRLKGITLPQFPRDEAWWNDGENLLEADNLFDAGFVPISANEMKKGDVVVANILSKVTNHVGIYMGGGVVLHHLYNRLSRKEPIGPWQKYCRHYLRYTG